MSEETAESLLAKTLFVVEASSFETQCLWAENAIDSDYRRFKPRRWEQINPGWSVTIGYLDSRPICVSMNWVRIDGRLVVFWEATSQVVDTVQIEKWFSQHFNGKWGGGREAKTNAINFHHCLDAIDEDRMLS